MARVRREKGGSGDWGKHLLVDGYNVVHQWEDLKILLKERGWEVAVDALFNRVRVIHDVEAVVVSMVLDGKGREVDVVCPSKEKTLAMVFAPSGITADGVIERMAEKGRRKGAITVATDDMALGQIVTGCGAVVISTKGLKEWVEACEVRQMEQLSRKKKAEDKRWKEKESPWDQLK